MKKFFFFAAMLLSGCSTGNVEDVYGKYFFDSVYDETSTCVTNEKQIKFVFEIASDSVIELDLSKDQTLSGLIATESFEVTGDNPYSKDQTLKFFTEEFSSGKASIITVLKNNPFCYSKFDGEFVLLDS